MSLCHCALCAFLGGGYFPNVENIGVYQWGPLFVVEKEEVEGPQMGRNCFVTPIFAYLPLALSARVCPADGKNDDKGGPLIISLSPPIKGSVLIPPIL